MDDDRDLVGDRHLVLHLGVVVDGGGVGGEVRVVKKNEEKQRERNSMKNIKTELVTLY